MTISDQDNHGGSAGTPGSGFRVADALDEVAELAAASQNDSGQPSIEYEGDGPPVGLNRFPGRLRTSLTGRRGELWPRPDVQPLLERLHHDVRALSVLLGVPGFPWTTEEQQAELQDANHRLANPPRFIGANEPAAAENVTALRLELVPPSTQLGPWEFRQVGPTTWGWVHVDAPAVPGADVTGHALIAAERRRQVTVEGYTADHDLRHGRGPLVRAAWCYENGTRTEWPWEPDFYKPKNPLRDLVRAGALWLAVREVFSKTDYDRESVEAHIDKIAARIDALLDEARHILAGGA